MAEQPLGRRGSCAGMNVLRRTKTEMNLATPGALNSFRYVFVFS